MSLRYRVETKVGTERAVVVARVESVDVATAVASGYREAARVAVADAKAQAWPLGNLVPEIDVRVIDTKTGVAL